MMIQGNYAKAAVEKWRQRKLEDDTLDKETDQVFTELLRWVDMVERKLDEVEVAANRRARYPF